MVIWLIRENNSRARAANANIRDPHSPLIPLRNFDNQPIPGFPETPRAITVSSGKRLLPRHSIWNFCWFSTITSPNKSVTPCVQNWCGESDTRWKKKCIASGDWSCTHYLSLVVYSYLPSYRDDYRLWSPARGQKALKRGLGKKKKKKGKKRVWV